MADTTASDAPVEPLARLTELVEQILLRIECLAADWEAAQHKTAPKSDVQSAPLIVSNLRRIDRGRLIGTADIYVPQWHVHFRNVLWQRWESGHETVNFPEREYVDKAGVRHYTKVVEFGAAQIFNRFCEAAVKAIHELETKNPPTETPT